MISWYDDWCKTLGTSTYPSYEYTHIQYVPFVRIDGQTLWFRQIRIEQDLVDV